jgi:NADH-quinone oxidoreductase subunit J
MNEVLAITGSATLLLAVGLWLMLPRGASPGRALGSLLVAVSLGLFASQVPRLGSWARDGVFFILAAVTVLSAVATVTFRNPVYSAIWFGLSLLGTAGLFLFQGAQFLGVATVVVYAGAILVTFLFVLMLAQPEGLAFYDRVSWGAWLSALSGALIVGVLTLTVIGVFQNPASGEPPTAPFQMPALRNDILADEHMAHLGAQLFSKHLVAVEVAGTLLLIALVGTVAIVSRIRKPAGQGGQSHG